MQRETSAKSPGEATEEIRKEPSDLFAPWPGRVEHRAAAIGIGTLFLMLGIMFLTPASRGDELRSPSADDGGDEDVVDESPRRSPQDAGRRAGSSELVFKDRVTSHWFHDNRRFWYRNDLHGGTKEFIVVDAVRGIREPAFEHAKLAASLSKAAGAEYRADKLPFDSIEFIDDDRAIRFNVGDAAWKCDL